MEWFVLIQHIQLDLSRFFQHGTATSSSKSQKYGENPWCAMNFEGQIRCLQLPQVQLQCFGRRRKPSNSPVTRIRTLFVTGPHCLSAALCGFCGFWWVTICRFCRTSEISTMNALEWGGLRAICTELQIKTERRIALNLKCCNCCNNMQWQQLQYSEP